MSTSNERPSPCGTPGHTIVNGMLCERCSKHCVLETPRERAARERSIDVLDVDVSEDGNDCE